MCGINGIYGLDDLSESKERVVKMNNALAHRGPDANGVFKGDNVVLGHSRLAIIDLNSNANQPFLDASKRFALVFNGEIYNYKQIKGWLKDYPFQTQSDTEVVLAAFMKWGPECLSRFDGMFAFAIWDNKERELFIARDRLGIKPLYYHLGKSTLAFSSEIRALIKSNTFEPKLDEFGLQDYLRYQTVHAPRTILEGVKMLMPGHYMIINDSDYKMEPYWQMAINYNKKGQSLDIKETKEEVKRLLDNSVEKRLVSDVPFGAFLSGGIDSSAMVAMMAKRSKQPIKTFTVAFEEEEFSEAKYARMVAKKFETDHTEIKLRPEDFLKDLPQALESLDHPSGDGPNTYVVSKAVKNAGVTMAISGLGGDELFAGYDVFKRSLKLQGSSWALSFPPGIRRLIARIIKMRNRTASGDKMAQLITSEYWDIAHTFPISRQVFKDDIVADLLNQKPLVSNAVADLVLDGIGYGTPGFDLPNLSKVSHAEISTYMQNVLLRDTDQMSMSQALEVRTPFLDHELVEFVLGIPDRHKNPKTPKQLLVESLGNELPSEIVNRPKMGFTLPWAQWMKDDLRDMVEESLKNLGKRDAFNNISIQNLWQRFLNNDSRITWSRIWHLVVLEQWMQKNGINA